MDRSEHIDDLLTRMRSVVEAAFDRGVKVGEAKGDILRKSILEAVGITGDPAISHGNQIKRVAKKRTSSGATRNPKGLTSNAVTLVMNEVGPNGYAMKEIVELTQIAYSDAKPKVRLQRTKEASLFVPKRRPPLVQSRPKECATARKPWLTCQWVCGRLYRNRAPVRRAQRARACGSRQGGWYMR